MKKEVLIKITCMCVFLFLIYPTVSANTDGLTKTNKNKTVTIYFDSFNENTKQGKEQKIAEISLYEAEIIKNKLLQAECDYQSEEKIKNQIKILHDHKLLPEEIEFDIFLNRLHKINDLIPKNQIQPRQAENRGFVFSGPSIESSLTVGGQTFSLKSFVGNVLEYYFGIELLDYQDNDTLNGTHFHSSLYSGPVFVGISPASAFVTTFGVIFSGPSFLYSPFISIRVLFGGAHLSAKIYECVNPVTVFDWHLNVALMGMLVYQSQNVIPK